MTSSAEYICTLDENTARRAEAELHEDDKSRPAALKAFEEWIIQQQKWLTSPTDAKFLLSFLRVRKFSQLATRESFINYWNARTVHPETFRDVDVTSKPLMALFKTGLFVPLPKRDEMGRKVLLFRIQGVDPSTKAFTSKDLVKAGMALHQFLLMDETTQVNGVKYLVDYTGFTMKHNAFLGAERVKFLNILTKAFPVRISNFNIYNAGVFMETLMQIVKTAMSSKMSSRVKTHSTMVSVYDVIDKSLLPAEYLPDEYEGPNAGELQTLVDNFVKDITQPMVVEWLMKLSSKKNGIDQKKRPAEHELSQQGSFIKHDVS